MLPMLDLGRAKPAPSPSPVVGEDIIVKEDGSYMFGNNDEKKATRATANGIYTIGENQFYVRKDHLIPPEAENVIYQEPEETVPTDEFVSDRIAKPSRKSRSNKNADETTSE